MNLITKHMRLQFSSYGDFCTCPIYIMTVHIIGDSHTDIYAGSQKCLVHAVGPITMFRWGRDGVHTILCMKNVNVKKDDIMVFVAGEIDCRCHIHPQIQQKSRTEEEVILSLASEYVDALVTFHNVSGVYVVVRGVVAPMDAKYHNDCNYPIRGSLEERVRWRKLLNKHLQRLCIEHGLLYLPSPAWSESIDGVMLFEKSDGVIHISQSQQHMELATDELFTLLEQAHIAN